MRTFSGYDYVLLDSKLVDGTKNIDDCMVGKEMSIPPISDPGAGGGYRVPGAHAAGAWVEPWSQIVAEGAPHFHFGFNSPANSDYGTCTQ